MARYIGANGVVDVGGNIVAEVRQFELQIQGPVAEAPAMGRSWAGHGVGATRVTGTVTCWLDHSDTTGQGALTMAADVALILQPEGVGSGLAQYSLSSAIITGEPITVERDSFAEVTFSFAANSDLDRTAQV